VTTWIGIQVPDMEETVIQEFLNEGLLSEDDI
jgi:hypothetical protein